MGQSLNSDHSRSQAIYSSAVFGNLFSFHLSFLLRRPEFLHLPVPGKNASLSLAQLVCGTQFDVLLLCHCSISGAAMAAKERSMDYLLVARRIRGRGVFHSGGRNARHSK